MLIDKFFNINETAKTDNGFSVKVNFNPEHKIFEGHFPDMPVVPGVCQIQMLKETLSKLLNKDYFIKTASSVKFLAVIEPLKVNELTMNIHITSEADGELNVAADYVNGNETFFRFKGALSAA